MVNSGELTQIVRATGEIYGKNVSEPAAIMFLADLSGYGGEQIKEALSRCRKELRTFPTVADVIARIDDGRPGVEEAWAMIPKDEEGSVVWTNEMAEAFGVCRGMIASDPVAARMAFKESYLAIVGAARAASRKPEWSPSFGFEKAGRAAAVAEAVSKRRLAPPEAQALLPDFTPPPRGGSPVKLTFIKEMPKQ